MRTVILKQIDLSRTVARGEIPALAIVLTSSKALVRSGLPPTPRKAYNYTVERAYTALSCGPLLTFAR
jgi:hypothetical protein